jgi:hypothetical protein
MIQMGCTALKATHSRPPVPNQLRPQRQAAMLQLRSESWTWDEIGAEIGAGRERAWQIGNGL